MDALRKQWNEQQQVLRRALGTPGEFQTARDLFFVQHAMVHSGSLSGADGPTFDDRVWCDLQEEAARQIPHGGEHSIAWTIWHAARIEDVTMNVLVAGRPQLWETDGWGQRTQVDLHESGNSMEAYGIARLSARVDMTLLRAYRLAVGRRTRAIVAGLMERDLKRRVDPLRLEQLRKEGAVTGQASWLLEYWAGLTIAGLMLMPPTRHNFVHLNEALRVRQKVFKA
jgi:hypothetical protein